ncbi:hypothetical protein DNH61_25155 [Paenibacillus sambharensis]|uniref:DUF4362 domain-containing protein n=1 Tax=Paenibacillus sambharensis TaxID=1803190 RepID=A0A2W1LMQ2_9BACL|nr:hypothetical protein [Paenibacillus sambharensis]PZD93071.1 hypothetical protein DNH61_25155 [Paenibacillus sambharensis]
MKVSKVLLITYILVSTLTACSGVKTQNQPASTHSNFTESESSLSETKQIPTIAYISIYKSGSNKSQPELFSVQSDERILKHVNDWKGSSVAAALPLVENIDRIYIFQYDYEMNGTSTAEYYMYIIDSEGNDYIKEFKYSEAFQNTTDKERILAQIGSDNWFKVSPRSKLLEP